MFETDGKTIWMKDVTSGQRHVFATLRGACLHFAPQSANLNLVTFGALLEPTPAGVTAQAYNEGSGGIRINAGTGVCELP